MSKKSLNFLLTCGGGPGTLQWLAAVKESKLWAGRVILVDINAASGNLFLPEVDQRLTIPSCSNKTFIPSICKIIQEEEIAYLYSGLDEEIPVLAAHADEIAHAGAKTFMPDLNGLDLAWDKWKMFKALHGKVNTPMTWILEPNNLKEPYDSLHGRLLIKKAIGRGGRDILLPCDQDEYIFYASRLAAQNKDQVEKYLAQQLIQGSEFNVSTLHDAHGNLVYSVSRRKFESRQIKSTTVAAVIEKNDDVISTALSALHNLGLEKGFNNVELIVSEQDGKPYVIEVNGGRTAAQDMNLLASGINTAELLVTLANGESVDPIPHPLDGTAILKIRKDVVVQLSDIENVKAYS